MHIAKHIVTRAKRGAPWLVAGNATSQLVSFAISVVVARILLPKDFGVYAMAQMFTEASYIIGNLGIGAALVQKKELSDRDRDVAFLSCIAVGGTLTLLLILAAPLIARLFANPLVGPILAWKSLEIVLNSSAATATGLLQRDLRFKPLALLDIAVLGVQAVVVVSLAVGGLGVWSLVWSTVASAAFRAVAANWLAGFVPRLVFHRDAFRQLVRFGTSLSLKNVMVIVGRNADNFVVGKFLGDAPLGNYARAFSLAMLPRQQIHGILHQITFSSFSRIQEDPRTLSEWFKKVAGAVALIMVPAMLGLALLANDFVLALYTERWAAVVLPLRVLCLAALPISLTGIVGSTLESTANLRIATLVEGVYGFCVAVGSFAVAYLFGINGVALVVLAASVGSFVAYGYVLRTLFAISLKEYFGVLTVPLFLTVLMLLCIAPLQVLEMSRVVRLFASAGAGMLAYATFTYLFARARYGYLWEQFADPAWRRRDQLPTAAPSPARAQTPQGRPAHCVFATHYADVARFSELVECWDTRAPGRNFSKALAFSAIYVDFITRSLGADVQIVFVDSSVLDLAAFLRATFPTRSVEEMSADAVRPSSSDLVCIKFPDNIGHLSVHGRDGWGRACMKGLEYCIGAGYEFAVHVEADLLVKGRQWVDACVQSHPHAGIIAPRMHLGLETGLFIARTAWLSESRFIERYDWKAVRNRPRPEERFAAIAADRWEVMPIAGGRGESARIDPESIRDADSYYLTHATAAEWRTFFEAAAYPVPEDLFLSRENDAVPHAVHTVLGRSRRSFAGRIWQRLRPTSPVTVQLPEK